MRGRVLENRLLKKGKERTEEKKKREREKQPGGSKIILTQREREDRTR